MDKRKVMDKNGVGVVEGSEILGGGEIMEITWNHVCR